jgi:hypothetical protein
MEALWRLYQGSIKALLRLYQGSGTRAGAAVGAGMRPPATSVCGLKLLVYAA